MRGLTNQCGVMGRGAVNGLLDHTGRNQLTARANIVTWPIDECMGSRSTQGATKGLTLLADRLPPNGYSPR